MSGNPLSDKTVVVTGTLSEMTRKEAEAKIVELGGTTASRVTAATDLLIAGEKAGSKKKQAETLGVEILDEVAFVQMIEGGEAEPVVLSKEQLKEIKKLLCSEDEADRQQAGDRLKAAQVTELDLSYCDGITDAGLPHLTGLTSLTTLNLDECSELTEPAVDALRKALPNCEISWEI